LEVARKLETPLVDAEMNDIFAALDKHPEIRAINQHILINEGFMESLEKDKALLHARQAADLTTRSERKTIGD